MKSMTSCVAALAACLLWAGAASAYNEAPELAAAVKAGKLPPVAKRLPTRPEVIKPVAKVGSYGGVLRSALRGNGDGNAILRFVSPQGLVRWSKDFSGLEPNLAESWTVSADATEFTFKLRPEMRWSDGKPFGVDDILFAMNDLVGNAQFFPSAPSRYTTEGKFVKLDKVDEHTVRFKFSKPYRTFIEELATPLGQHSVMYPKHYCQQFHPKYNPKVDDDVRAQRAQDWVALMRLKCGDLEVVTRWGNPEKPTLDPWVIEEPYNGGATRVLMRRNPYFWQVDTAGNQLPYIDKLEFKVISDIETIILAAVNGQLDMQIRHIDNTQNLPLLSENEVRGKYKLLQLPSVNASSIAVFMNQTTKNEKLRALLRTKDFRIALSLGMNRPEINDLIFLGQGEPWQIGPARANKFFNEKLAKQYTQLDVKGANALLDKLLLNKRDADGYRLYPTGGRITMGVIVSLAAQYQVDMLELLRKQWARIGLDLQIQASERTLYYDRANANDYDLSVDSVSGGYDPTQSPRAFLSVHPQESRQSLPWVQWYESGGKRGEEPNASMKRRLQLYDQWKDARTSAEADTLFRQILAIAADELEVLGTVSPPKANGIRSARLMNVYDKMPWGWTYPTPGPSLLQQYYFTK